MRFLYYSCICFLFVNSLHAQVGINTRNPQGVVTWDGAGDNADTPTAAQLTNDVQISAAGNMSVGTSPSGSRLHLKSSVAYGAFRMEDGQEGTGRILQGDASGNTYWATLKGAGGTAYSISPNTTFSENTTVQMGLTVAGSEIPISANGNFAVVVSWSPFVTSAGSACKPVTVIYYLRYRRGGVLQPTILQTIKTTPFILANTFNSMFAMLVGQGLQRGDTLFVQVRVESSGGSNLYINNTTWPGSPSLLNIINVYNSSKVIFFQL